MADAPRGAGARPFSRSSGTLMSGSRATCRGAGPDLFFPERGERTAPALAYCEGCSVRQECLEVEERFVVGVWGGTTGRQRRLHRGVA